MRVPTRKPGKYAGQKPDPYITREKHRELEAKLGKLKNARPGAIAEVKRLAADGDFSENAAYSIAKGKLRGLNQRILETEDHLKKAVIIAPEGNGETVALGSLVTIAANGKEKTYRLLGSTETDPAAGVISHHSPLGAALLGHRAGDRIKIRLKDKDIEYKIIGVR
jgi:transcription elongation factor GreA